MGERSPRRRPAGRLPLWLSLTAWAVAAALVATAAGMSAAHAMGLGLEGLLDSAAGRPGQFDVLVQVREDRAAEAMPFLRSVARTGLGGAAVQQGPAVAGSVGLLVDLPPQLEQGSTFQALGELLGGVPGYVAWVPLVEPSVLVDRLHPRLLGRLEQELARAPGVRFAFRYGSGLMVVASRPQEAAALTRWLQRWLRPFRLYRLVPEAAPQATPGDAGPDGVQGRLLAEAAAELLRDQGLRVLHQGAAQAGGSPEEGRARQLAELLLQYATTAQITLDGGSSAAGELDRGAQVVVGPLAAEVVRSGPEGALAVVTDPDPPPELLGQELPVTVHGRRVGTARLAGLRLELQAALQEADELLGRWQAPGGQLERASQLLERLQAQLQALSGGTGSPSGRLDQVAPRTPSPDVITRTLITLALGALLGDGTSGGSAPLQEAAEGLQQTLEQLRQGLAELGGSPRGPVGALGRLAERLPQVDGDAVAAALRAVDPRGQLEAPVAGEVLAEGLAAPAAEDVEAALAEALPAVAVRVHATEAGVLTPSARASALALVHRAQQAMGLAVAGLAVAYTLLNDWACLAAASQAVLAGRSEVRRRRARRAWQLGGALVGAALAAAAGWPVVGGQWPGAMAGLAAAGGLAGWLAARLAPRLAPVDPDAVEAAVAFGLDGSAVLVEVVLPGARPWLLAWLHVPLRRLGRRAGPAQAELPSVNGTGRPTAGGSPRPGPWPVLEAVGLVKRFGNRKALDGFSLRLAAGETVALMGPSGCGKSTAVRCLAGLCEPDGGEVRLLGRPLAPPQPGHALPRADRIAVVFQRPQLVGHLSVVDNVALPLVAAGEAVGRARRRALEALEQVGMAPAASKLPSQLSGGEGQRVAIARALVRRPEVILWDEPTAHLDPARVAEFLQLVKELARRLRTTMLIVTHQGRFACQVAHRLVLMDHGRVVEEGPPERILGQPRSDVGRRFAALAAL